ncbi:hypothetical protein HYFRA_00003576 [Hymenoscyphus fraxineus]|uniref:Uncharacterized protein n=1 Tax=Hymenoscyphus fraxineus TaxID=746836 RepID=A0A9N9KSI3_9HELO|nr:hypothetical protein HYFRA_00003576 [Hymenoscyphus fraxineus]
MPPNPPTERSPRRWKPFENALLISLYPFKSTSDQKTDWEWVSTTMNTEFTRRGMEPPRAYTAISIKNYFDRSRNELFGKWGTDGVKADVYIRAIDVVRVVDEDGDFVSFAGGLSLRNLEEESKVLVESDIPLSNTLSEAVDLPESSGHDAQNVVSDEHLPDPDNPEIEDLQPGQDQFLPDDIQPKGPQEPQFKDPVLQSFWNSILSNNSFSMPESGTPQLDQTQFFLESLQDLQFEDPVLQSFWDEIQANDSLGNQVGLNPSSLVDHHQVPPIETQDLDPNQVPIQLDQEFEILDYETYQILTDDLEALHAAREVEVGTPSGQMPEESLDIPEIWVDDQLENSQYSDHQEANTLDED